MIKANFNTYNNYVTDSLYQWDVNQGLVINGLNLSVAPEIHFANADMDRAIVRQSTLESGVVTVRIPNSLLQAALTIKAYVGIYEGETFKVIETIEIPVIAKTKPADYTIEDTDEEIYSFNKIENEIIKTKKDIEEYVADKCRGKAGIIYPLATADVPKGFLLCDGAEYSRAEYEELFKAIGITYGAGNGVTTFNVPNLSTNTVVNCVISTGKEMEFIVGAGGFAARLIETTLLASAWTGENSLYSQVVTIDGITEYSKVDLLPSVEQLAIFHNKDVAFVAENEDGVVTVYAIGDKPTQDYTMQAQITEVKV